MPLITSIKPQKRDKKRFNLFLDGKFAFGVDGEILLKYRLENGASLPLKTIDQILKEEETGRLFDACLKFLSFRPRSEREVRDYLAKKISHKEKVQFLEAKESRLIEGIVNKLKKLKFVNDYEFAKWWADSRIKTRPRGIILIKSELIRKGIEKEIIEKVLSKVSSQTELALKSLDKKISRWKNLNAIEFKKKAYTYLAFRGFEFETIKEAVAHLEKRR